MNDLSGRDKLTKELYLDQKTFSREEKWRF